MLEKLARLQALEVRLLQYLQSPLLLGIRLVWGTQFLLTGWGKLNNLEKTTQFFAGLGIPAPGINALMAGLTEWLGGLLLLIGLGSRVVTIPLAVTMVVALLTAHRSDLGTAWAEKDLDKVATAAPFPFLVATLVILVFGPGKASLDNLVAHWFAHKKGQEKAPGP